MSSCADMSFFVLGVIKRSKWGTRFVGLRTPFGVSVTREIKKFSSIREEPQHLRDFLDKMNFRAGQFREVGLRQQSCAMSH